MMMNTRCFTDIIARSENEKQNGTKSKYWLQTEIWCTAGVWKDRETVWVKQKKKEITLIVNLNFVLLGFLMLILLLIYMDFKWGKGVGATSVYLVARF